MADLEPPAEQHQDMITVVIADDHEVVRRGIRSLLATISDVEVIGEAASGNEVTAMATELLPDVVLLDLQMPDGHGLDATRSIATALPSVAIVILTMYEDLDSIEAALRAGARGYLLKGASQGDVVSAIRVAARGHVVLGPGPAERLLERLTATRATPVAFPELTNRERDVLRLVADGHNNTSIARSLTLAPKTVANHVSNILTKLQMADRAEAIVTARRAGFTDS